MCVCLSIICISGEPLSGVNVQTGCVMFVCMSVCRQSVHVQSLRGSSRVD